MIVSWERCEVVQRAIEVRSERGFRTFGSTGQKISQTHQAHPHYFALPPA